MLCLKSVTRLCLRQPNSRNHRLKEIFSESFLLRKENNGCFYSTWYKTVIRSLSNKPSFLISLGKGQHLTSRRMMGEAVIKNDGQYKSYFQQLMYSRKKEAQRSVLLEISKKEDIPYALAVCESFGSIANAYSYAGEGDNCFLLLEFSDESFAQGLLSNCQCKSISDVFPVSSRLIQFERRHQTDLPKVNIGILEDSAVKSPVNKKKDISALIDDIFSTEKLSELSTRMRYFFCILIKDSLSGLFPYCDVLPFGSSVNGIGKQDCDLDVMIRLYPEEIRNDSELYFLNKTCVGDIKSLQQKTISCIGDILRTFFPGVTNVQKILHARMPILKLQHRLLKMDCDVSINNLSSVYMSEIIHFSGEIDFRVRPLLHAVKKWAKEANVTYDKPGTWITNFGLTTLVLFFLQNRPIPILPAFNDALVIQGDYKKPGFKIQYLKSLEELKTSAAVNEESLATLLKEFLIFLGTYSFEKYIISLMSGKPASRNGGPTIWVQYPFEDELNITKNVSELEFVDTCEKAMFSAKYLANYINQNACFKDLSTALGIPKLKEKNSSKSKKISGVIDVDALLEKNPKSVRNKAMKHKMLRRIY